MATNVEMSPEELWGDRDRLATLLTRRTQTRGDQQAKSPLQLKWPTQKKRMPTTSSPPTHLGQPTEDYPFKRCQVHVGHSVVPLKGWKSLNIWEQR